MSWWMNYMGQYSSLRLIYVQDTIRSTLGSKTLSRQCSDAISDTLSSWSCRLDWPTHRPLSSLAWTTSLGDSWGSTFWYSSMIYWYTTWHGMNIWHIWRGSWVLCRHNHYMPRNPNVSLAWDNYCTWGISLVSREYRFIRRISGPLWIGQHPRTLHSWRDSLGYVVTTGGSSRDFHSWEHHSQTWPIRVIFIG